MLSSPLGSDTLPPSADQPVPEIPATTQRYFTNTKRFKLIQTCDSCKQRKVKCDKARPSCGACRKSNRECSYTFSRDSHAKRARPLSDLELLHAELESIQSR